MKYTFVIKGRLPGFNDIYGSALSNRNQANRLKQKTQKEIMWTIVEQLKNLKITKPVFIEYQWYEPNRKRDLDNIAGFGHKCIQDSLVKRGVLHNDGWKQIIGFKDLFYVDKDNPHIVVTLIEQEDVA